MGICKVSVSAPLPDQGKLSWVFDFLTRCRPLSLNKEKTAIDLSSNIPSLFPSSTQQRPKLHPHNALPPPLPTPPPQPHSFVAKQHPEALADAVIFAVRA